jgi:putative sulfotransferase
LGSRQKEDLRAGGPTGVNDPKPTLHNDDLPRLTITPGPTHREPAQLAADRIDETEAIVSVPTFVVGTSRCGSTMLSNMLREHPQVLSLSEFFATVTDGARTAEPFSSEPMDGLRFWSIISAITPMPSFALQHCIPCDEWLYPCDTPTARFSRKTGVPAILLTSLPHLTYDHDALFNVLSHEVMTWQIAPVGEQYRRLFTWLSGRFAKRAWVERSGASLISTKHLLATFPDARFIHVARDGRDAALSMRKHLAFVLGVSMFMLWQHLGVDPLQSPDRTHLDRVPAELLPFLPENFDAGALRAYPVSLQLCGEFWTQQIEAGLEVLRALPPDRLLTLRYEDFFVDPKRQLEKFAAFLGGDFVDEDWSTRCAATVRKPRSTWRDLPEADARAVAEACRPGFELLREVGIRYDL